MALDLKYILYLGFSVFAMLINIAYAIQSKVQFYPILLYLVSSKASIIITGNLFFAIAVFIGKLSETLFLGNLRDSEIEILWSNSKFAIVEALITLAMFRQAISPIVVFLVGSMLLWKSFHWIAKARLDYAEQVQPTSRWPYVRLGLLLVSLVFLDALFCWKAVVQSNSSMIHGIYLYLGFEFGLLFISAFRSNVRFLLFLLDSFWFESFQSKGVIIMILEIICDGVKFLVYAKYFYRLFGIIGLPINILRDVLYSFHKFGKRISSFLKYLQLTQNIDERFENASEEEIENAGNCLICREGMIVGQAKKLPCNHVFHLSCLKSWLQHQQSCPLCRSDIPFDYKKPQPQPTDNNGTTPAAIGTATSSSATISASPITSNSTTTTTTAAATTTTTTNAAATTSFATSTAGSVDEGNVPSSSTPSIPTNHKYHSLVGKAARDFSPISPFNITNEKYQDRDKSIESLFQKLLIDSPEDNCFSKEYSDMDDTDLQLYIVSHSSGVDVKSEPTMDSSSNIRHLDMVSIIWILSYCL